MPERLVGDAPRPPPARRRHALSAAGDMLLVVVLALRVHDLTGSGFAVAALFGALMVPIVLLAPLAGRLVDRVETRRLLLLVSLAQAGGRDRARLRRRPRVDPRADRAARRRRRGRRPGRGGARARRRPGRRAGAGQRLGRDRALRRLHRRPAARRRADRGRRHATSGWPRTPPASRAVALAAALMHVRRVPVARDAHRATPAAGCGCCSATRRCASRSARRSPRCCSSPAR